MPYTLALEDLNRTTKGVGNKAANLGVMIKAGLPVPTGFVITAEAFELFLKVNRLEDRVRQAVNEIDADNTDQLRQKSKEIEDLVLSGEIPDIIRREIRDSYENIGVGKEARLLGGAALDIIRAGRDRVFVAVRSSAVVEDSEKASFAGQMRTYVNINGVDRLLEAVKRCWASAFTSRAIYYRKKKGLQNFSTGIVIQKMIEPEKAGTLFTADPISGDKTKILIEASYGLGQSVASGLVIPDKYILDKQTNQLVEKSIGKKSILFRKDQIGKTIIETVSAEKSSLQSLLDPEISKLIEISKRVESLYGGQPQDVEWCIERGRVFVVQSRPITAMATEQPFAPDGQQENPIISGWIASKGKSKGKTRIANGLDQLSKITDGDILVAKTTNPDFIPYIGKISGLITDEGGITSHFAIVSREFSLPFISATEKSTQLFKDGQDITMDAFSGSVYEQQAELDGQPTKAIGQQNIPEENDFAATEIKLVVRLPEEAEKINSEADGINPLAIEQMVAENRKNPAYLARANPHELVSFLVEKIGKAAISANKKPVWYKLIDLKAEEFQGLEGAEEEIKETNPLLGRKGVRASLANQEVLKCELKALKLLRENGIPNVNLLLPFVTTPEEVNSIKSQIDFPIRIGIIAETPASILNIEEIANTGIDIVLIGLNNLIQLTLGVDRRNPNISHLYSESNDAVMKMIKKTIHACKSLGIRCEIFGDGADISHLVERLVEFGISSISVDYSAFQQTKSQVIRAERRLLLDKIRKAGPSFD